MFMPTSLGPRRTLADMIMDKIKEKEQFQEMNGNNNSNNNGFDTQDDVIKRYIDPKVQECYTQVGTYLHHYTSGKIPKAFKIIPSLKNWQEILYLTQPEQWSAQAMFAATRLFASNLNPKMAQQFYAHVLLPRIRTDIESHKRLNFHLYQAIKKALYKPTAFFKGIFLPLALDGCTVKESVILSSVLTKCTVPVLHSSVALLRLASTSIESYSGTATLLMKTLLNKKYSLPFKVVTNKNKRTTRT